MSNNLRIVVLVGVCLHIPDNLVREELRELSSLKNVAFHITQYIVSQSLDNLRDVKERYVNGMAFQCPHCVLD